MNTLELIEREQFRTDLAPFKVGDTVRVHVKIIEGEKERIKPFEGVVIARRGDGIRESFMVRKVSFGIGVERVCPLHSPALDRIEVVKRGSVRRARLFYLREKKGKAAKIKEKERTAASLTKEA